MLLCIMVSVKMYLLLPRIGSHANSYVGLEISAVLCLSLPRAGIVALPCVSHVLLFPVV